MPKNNASISIETYLEKLALIKGVDVQLTAAAGSISKRRADALTQITAAEHAFLETIDEGADLDLSGLVVRELALATDRLEAAKDAFAEAKNAVDEAINGHIRALKVDTESASLKEQRAALVVQAGSVLTVLEMMGVDISTVEAVPSAPKGSSTSSITGSRPRSASTSKANYSYSRDGVKWTVPCEAQNSLSSIASRVFNHVPTADLKAEILSTGIESLTSDYSVRVTCNGVTASIAMSTKGDIEPAPDGHVEQATAEEVQDMLENDFLMSLKDDQHGES